MPGIHWDGDGARRRRFCPGGLGVVVVVTAATFGAVVVVDEEQEALLLLVSAGEEFTRAARLPLLDTVETLLS